jgi:Na+/melibiose symporter-like transporter
MSFTIMTAAAPYVAEDLLHGSLDDVPLLLGPFLGAALPCFALVPRLVRKWGWEKTTLIATSLLGVVYASTGALGFSVVGSPVHTAMIVFALGGPMAAVLLGLENEAIIACAAATGNEVTSVYLGVYNFVVKALNGVALFLTGVLSTQTPTLGPIAIRCMGFLAGALLVLGVVAYVSLRPAPSSSVAPRA